MFRGFRKEASKFSKRRETGNQWSQYETCVTSVSSTLREKTRHRKLLKAEEPGKKCGKVGHLGMHHRTTKYLYPAVGLAKSLLKTIRNFMDMVQKSGHPESSAALTWMHAFAMISLMQRKSQWCCLKIGKESLFPLAHHNVQTWFPLQ